jgi:FdhE protein
VTRKTDQEILRRLAEARQKHGQLRRSLELYSELLQLQADVELRIQPQEPIEKAAEGRLKEGMSILELEDLSLNWSLVQQVFGSVAETVAKYLPEDSDGAGGVKSITSSSFPLHQAIEDCYRGSSLLATALAHGVSEELLSSVTLATLQPLLKPHSEALIKLVQQKQWRRRQCPVCGGKPDLAFLDKESGARWLLCSRCDAEWAFQRLECPHCGNTDQKSLAYFTDEAELYRLYVCERCRGYIKAIDLRKTESAVLLHLERIVTSGMDKDAGEKGYKRQVTGIVPLEEIGELC